MTPIDSGKWDSLLSFVATNPYSDLYREKYAGADYALTGSITTYEDIQRIPLLSKKELAEAGIDRLRFVPEEEVSLLSPTSGTTSGKPLVTCIASSPFAPRSAERSDFGRVLVLFGALRIPLIHHFQTLRGDKTIAGDIHNLPATCAIAAAAKVQTIFGTPTTVILIRPYLDAYPELFASIRYIRLGGEPLTENKKQFIRSLYPHAEVYSIYASSEVGRAASQCSVLAASDAATEYHIDTNGFFCEILDPETGAPVAMGEAGELVVTDFTNFGTPLIRYRSGDRARFSDTPCACGAPGPLLSVTGRIQNESVRAGGFELQRDAVQRALATLSDVLIDTAELYATETYQGTTPRITLELRVMPHEGVSEGDTLAARICRAFEEEFRVSPNMTLGQAMQRGLFAPITVRFVSFPLSSKSTITLTLT